MIHDILVLSGVLKPKKKGFEYFTISRMGRFLKYHFGVIMLFSFIYWVHDIFCELGYTCSGAATMRNPVKKSTPNTVLHQDPRSITRTQHLSRSGTFSNYFYWLWFSLLTQTTVGYGLKSLALVMGFESVPGPVFLALNTIQLASVLLITAALI